MKTKKINCKDFRLLISSVTTEVKEMFNGVENHGNCANLLSPDRVLTVTEAEKVLERLKQLSRKEELFGSHVDCDADTRFDEDVDVCYELDCEFITNSLKEAFEVFKTKVKNEEFRKSYLVRKILKTNSVISRYWTPAEEKAIHDSFNSQTLLLQDVLTELTFILDLSNLFTTPDANSEILYAIRVLELDTFILTYKETNLKIITHSESLKVKDDTKVAYLPSNWNDTLLETVHGFYTGVKDGLTLQEAVNSAILMEEHEN